MAIELYREPETPGSSQPEDLLDAIWMNELRKRTWINLVIWDKYDGLLFIFGYIFTSIVIWRSHSDGR
jgi:hypothetical protein